MNHSIYSADRATHLKVVVVALVAGIAVAGLGITARTGSDEGLTQTARVIKADKPVCYHQRECIPRSLRRSDEFFEFTRLFTSPPKSPRGYVDDPNPKSTTESARPPRALSHVWGCDCRRARQIHQTHDCLLSCSGRAATRFQHPPHSVIPGPRRMGERSDTHHLPSPLSPYSCASSERSPAQSTG
ncbi:hypothetical protein ABH975_006518 [Bradyrhizobium ottawaense]